MEETNQEKR